MHGSAFFSGSAWAAARPTICRSLGHSLSAEETVAALSGELDQTYRTVAANLPSNPGALVEQVDGKDDLIVTPLDKLDEPDSLVKLRAEVNARLPRVDLPEVLLEIAARTDFTSKFTHVSERESENAGSDRPASARTSSPRPAILGWSRLLATTFRRCDGRVYHGSARISSVMRRW